MYNEKSVTTLLNEINKLSRWIDGNVRRQIDIADALKPTGVKNLNRIFEIAAQLRDESQEQ